MKKLYTPIWTIFIFSTYLVINESPSTIWYDLILFTSYGLSGLLLIIYIWLKYKNIKTFSKELFLQIIIYLLWFLIVADLIHYNYEYYMFNLTAFVMILISHKNILKLK